MRVSLSAKQPWLSLSSTMLLVSVVLVGCSGLFGGNTPRADSSVQLVALSKLRWCNNKQNETFMDDAAPAGPSVTNSPSNALKRSSRLGPANGTPVAISRSVFRANLGLTVFLPAKLPDGSCMLESFGWLRNASSHNSFIITYLLPDQSSLTIAQTRQTGQKAPFQCFVSPDPSDTAGNTPTAVPGRKLAPVQLCSGVRDSTNITFSARWTSKEMQQFFNDLQTGVDWIPAS